MKSGHDEHMENKEQDGQRDRQSPISLRILASVSKPERGSQGTGDIQQAWAAGVGVQWVLYRITVPATKPRGCEKGQRSGYLDIASLSQARLEDRELACTCELTHLCSHLCEPASWALLSQT